MTAKIALEEHFMSPGFEEYSKPFTSLMTPQALQSLSAQLSDFDEMRLSAGTMLSAWLTKRGVQTLLIGLRDERLRTRQRGGCHAGQIPAAGGFRLRGRLGAWAAPREPVRHGAKYASVTPLDQALQAAVMFL